jgi:hypothetical protein
MDGVMDPASSDEAIESVRQALGQARRQLEKLDELVRQLDRAVTRSRREHARLVRVQRTEDLAKIARLLR